MACLAVLSLTTRQGQHQQALWEARSEVEARAASLAAEVLDFGGTVPFEDASGDASDALYAARSLDALDGRTEQVRVPAGADTLAFEVRTAVEAVRKDGGDFVAAEGAGPYRRLHVWVEGPLDVEVIVERVYAELAR